MEGSIKKRLEAIQKAVGWSTVEDFYAYQRKVEK